jgi:lipoate-protein ligase A
MTEQLFVLRTASTDPVHNLALEETVFEALQPGWIVLYLWQNDNTVVIGRNQCAWSECDLEALKQDHVKLVRRASGGGAVYHDMGNLNFTFLMDDAHYSLDRQNGIVRHALKGLGIEAQVSGRNDLTAAGRKFSGCAFVHRGGFSYQHGTLLVHEDLDKLPRYLCPDPAKFRSKGVASVRARVINLSTLCPQLTIADLADSLQQAFEAAYGQKAAPLQGLDEERLKELMKIYGSKEWILGTRIPFDVRLARHFDWGSLQLELQIRKGHIADLNLWSDAMNFQGMEALKEKLKGCPFSAEAMGQAARDTLPDQEGQDLSRYFLEQEAVWK